MAEIIENDRDAKYDDRSLQDIIDEGESILWSVHYFLILADLLRWELMNANGVIQRQLNKVSQPWSMIKREQAMAEDLATTAVPRITAR